MVFPNLSNLDLSLNELRSVGITPGSFSKLQV